MTESLTFLFHIQSDVLDGEERGTEEAELELTKNVALIETAVIKGDVFDTNGHFLQVLAPIPGQTALKGSIHFFWSIILIFVYLGRREENMNTHRRFHIICNTAAATYMGFLQFVVFVFLCNVVPIHTRLCFDLLPLHTGDAGQLHGCAQHSFRVRRDIDAYRPARVD